MICEEFIDPTFSGMDKYFLSWSIGDTSEMDSKKNAETGWIAGIDSLKVGFKDFKIHLRRVYEVVYDGLKQNKKISTKAKIRGLMIWKGALRSSWEK